MSCQHRHDDAAYVLGALDPESRVRFENHLAGCDACREAVRQLTRLPGILAHAPVSDMDETAVPDVLPGLLARVRRDRRARQWRVTLIAAAAAVLLAVVGVTVVEMTVPSLPRDAVAAELVPVETDGVWGKATLIAHPEGTEIRLHCSYPTGGGEGAYGKTFYQLVVVNRGGDVDNAGTWYADADGAAEVTLFTRWSPDGIASLEIQTSDGRTVLRWEH